MSRIGRPVRWGFQLEAVSFSSMLILMHNLPDEFVVWDKAAEVDFRKPGTGTVRASFEVGEERLRQIRETVEDEGVAEPEFDVEVVDESGEVVADVHKTVHVRESN